MNFPYSVICERLVMRVERDAVVSILGVKAGLPGVRRHRHGLVEGRLARVGLPGAHLVQVLEVHRPPRLSWVLLHDHHHPAAPLCWHAKRNLGQDPHLDIIVQLLLDCSLPMHWNGLVECDWALHFCQQTTA